MHKPKPPIEWHVAESEAEWQRLCAPPLPDATLNPATQRRLAAQRLLGSVAILLCLLTGAWWWHTDQATLSTEVRGTAHPKQGAGTPSRNSLATRNIDHPSASRHGPQGGRERSELSAAVSSAEFPDYMFDAVQTFEVHGDQALTSVVMYTEYGEPMYRQTRFYRRIENGWQRMEPDAALWGAERSLETPSFIFHFRQNDAPVVVAVASQIEALYTTLRRNLGLPLTPSATKRVIEVSVTQTPGYVTPWSGAPARILVASPAVYLTPADLTDAELLVQSIALPLLTDLVAQTSESYEIGASWQPLVSGLYLWQVWELDLPLADWREEVVTWFYADLSNSRPGQAIVLPDRYTALCAAHQLWMPAPTQINIPLLCMGVDWEDFYLSLWRWYDPLNQLGAPSHTGDSLEESDSLPLAHPPGQPVALATLIEYMVATYGDERLPALLAGLGQFDTWDTLLPAVFGLSSAEFEAGWRMYLAAHYGVPTRD